MNRLGCLPPAIALLGENLKILPATGGAVVEMTRPDGDEIEDQLLNKDKEITEFLETPTPDPKHLVRETPPLYRSDNHLFRFFIDGSMRNYYLGTAIENNHSFPIILAQIGAAVMTRDAEGHIHPFRSRQKLLILIPFGNQLGVSDSVWRNLKKLNSADGYFEIVNATEKNANAPRDPSANDLREHSIAIVRNRMHKLEIALIRETDGLRNDENRLILDGSVKIDELIDDPYLIGVAKSFRKDPIFKFGHSIKRLDITSILAGLPYAHRTVAFSSQGGNVAFWYVRLREQKEVDYPLMGVIKVEVPRLHGEPITADEADLISRALLAERSVTPYGKDARWHCHLYPIYQAEETIKNGYYSQDVLMGMIRWPRSKLEVES